MKSSEQKKRKFFPEMERLTVLEVREYLKKKKSIIIPIGVIEQHGYHLPLNTDALIAKHLALKIGQELGILVAPAMYESFSGGECPGTVNISPAVMSLVISDRLTSLAKQGFSNFYLLLCHGGSENARALNDAIKVLLRTHPLFAKSLIAMLPVWKLNSPNVGWSKAAQEGDWHAGWLETSMVLALEPSAVRLNHIRLDAPALVKKMRQHPDHYQVAEKIADHPFVVPRFHQNDNVRVGVMGDPFKASAALGRQIVADIVKNAVRHIEIIEKKKKNKYFEIEFTPEPIILTDDLAESIK